MNSKLYHKISKEFYNSEEELKIARNNFKQNKSDENNLILKIAETKFTQWQKALNYLYLSE